MSEVESSQDLGGDPSSSGRAIREVKEIADEDSKYVRRWKIFLIAIIVIAGAFVSVGIYFYLSELEEREVEDNVSSITLPLAPLRRSRFLILFLLHFIV